MVNPGYELCVVKTTVCLYGNMYHVNALDYGIIDDDDDDDDMTMMMIIIMMMTMVILANVSEACFQTLIVQVM